MKRKKKKTQNQPPSFSFRERERRLRSSVSDFLRVFVSRLLLFIVHLLHAIRPVARMRSPTCCTFGHRLTVLLFAASRYGSQIETCVAQLIRPILAIQVAAAVSLLA